VVVATVEQQLLVQLPAEVVAVEPVQIQVLPIQLELE
jgi:hypothetical protein